MNKPGVYILQSTRDNRYYIGSTNNIDKRIEEHNRGLVWSTNRMRPLVLKVFIECQILAEARSSEYLLKRYKRKDIIEKTINDSMFPWDFIMPR